MAQSPGPTEPKWGQSAQPARCWCHFHFRFAECLGGSVHGVSDAQSRWRPSWVVSWPCVRLAGKGLVSCCLKSMVELTHYSYKYPHSPFGEIEIRKWGLASYSALKFILCRVEREARFWGLEDFWHVGSPPSSSSVKAVPESIRVRQSFLSSSSVKCRSSTKIMWILIKNWLLSPSGVFES
jgi:hypothetical protein